MRKSFSLLTKFFVGLAVLATIGWSMLALYFDAGAANSVLPFVYCAICLAILFYFRPFYRAVAVYTVVFALFLFWWLNLEPQMGRDWSPEYAKPARVEIQGSLVTFHNIRNFEYRSESDFTPHWQSRTYDLDRLVGLDMFFSYWGSPHIAHTILSWEFDDAPPLAISIETRREKGETYSAVAGFFRQFELYYVVADERDLVGLRTNYRHEDVYLYRLRGSVQDARALLLDYIKTINALTQTPRWYNAFSHNCTTTIQQHVHNIAAGRPWNWRLLANGHLPELGYMRGSINTDLPFDDLLQKSHINQRAVAAGITPEYSRKIREGLPARPRSD